MVAHRRTVERQRRPAAEQDVGRVRSAVTEQRCRAVERVRARSAACSANARRRIHVGPRGAEAHVLWQQRYRQAHRGTAPVRSPAVARPTSCARVNVPDAPLHHPAPPHDTSRMIADRPVTLCPRPLPPESETRTNHAGRSVRGTGVPPATPPTVEHDALDTMPAVAAPPLTPEVAGQAPDVWRQISSGERLELCDDVWRQISSVCNLIRHNPVCLCVVRAPYDVHGLSSWREARAAPRAATTTC